MIPIIRTVLIYWFLLLLLRLTGRRAGNKMTTFEWILIFLFGGMTLQSVVMVDRSIVNAMLCVATLSLLHQSVALLKRKFPVFVKIIDGTPVVLYEDGEWHHDRMQKLQLQESDVLAAAREKGFGRTDQIKYAMVERNGNISIVPRAR
jgi:uncharacterized membrane protein YcaP (DUF421 family)